MSDQQAPPSGDTPAVAGPDQAPGTAQEQPQIDWEKRYQDLQPEYTRTTQQLRELEQQKQWYEIAVTSEDPDTRRQAYEALGYEFPEEEGEPEPAQYEDPYDELRAEVTSVRQQLNQAQKAEQEAREGQIIDQLSREQLKQMGLDNEQDQDLVLGYAINALPPVRQPPGALVRILPDVKGAFEFFQNRETERQKAWATTKRTPYVAPGGQSATEVPDLSTHDGRVQFAMQKIAEQQDQA